MLKHSEQQSEMNEFVSKMIEKVSFNYLRMKRGQDVYWFFFFCDFIYLTIDSIVLPLYITDHWYYDITVLL